MNAAEHYEDLKRNAEAIDGGTVEWDEFSKRNKEIWRAIEADGLTDEVKALWVKDNPVC